MQEKNTGKKHCFSLFTELQNKTKTAYFIQSSPGSRPMSGARESMEGVRIMASRRAT